MAWTELFSIHTLPDLARVVSVFAIGAWIYFSRPGEVAHRSLALALFFDGVSNLAGIFGTAGTEPALGIAGLRVSWAAAALEAGALLHFVTVFPTRDRLGGSRWWPAMLALGAGTYAGLCILWPAFLGPLGPTPAEFTSTTANFISYEAALGTWLPVDMLAEPVAALALALRWRNDPQGVHQRSLLVLVVAYAAPVLFAATDGSIFALYNGVAAERTAYGETFFWYAYGAGVLSWLLAAAAATIVTAGNASDGGRVPRARIALFTAPVAAGIVTSVTLASGPAFIFVAGVMGLTFPILIGFAVMRTQLLGIDTKFRFTIKSGTLAAMFVTVIFAVSEGAQLVFGDEQPWFGVAAGAGLIFALAPLQRFADRVASTAVPMTDPPLRMDDDEKTVAFEEILRMAWADGRITPAERVRLDAARVRLGLSVDKAHQVEQRLLRSS